MMAWLGWAGLGMAWHGGHRPTMREEYSSVCARV
jgi:hypothetical protein